jgi:phosphoglycerate dehydrogenase-like enzyme
MPNIAIPDDSPAVLGPSPAFQELLKLGDVVHFSSLPDSQAELIERIRQAEIVINIRSSCRFTSEVFAQCPKLQLLSVWGTGTDNVDLVAAERSNVMVTNTPRVSAFSVAEHTLALMLAVAHGITVQNAAVREGHWPRGQAVELRNKTLGIIGMGAIGSRFAELGEGIGMRVIAWTMNPKPAAGVTFVEFDDLLRMSDVVSVHVRLSPRTEALIGNREFGLMKKSAILVNTARGAILDETALVEALEKGRIAGAGLDVFATEPLPSGHPLTKLPNVVLTPHSAGVTPEALESGLQLAVENVRNYLAAPASQSSVPATNVVVPRHRESSHSV